MKRVEYLKPFVKAYRKRILPHPKLDAQFEKRLELFLAGVREQPLNDHALTQKMKGLRSFSVAGDIRLIYRETDDAYEFIDIGTHNQVYG